MSKMPRIGAVLLALLVAGCALPEEPVDSADAATTAG
jgi:PBP1b-binding outer membrane lipoprotein LpoB